MVYKSCSLWTLPFTVRYIHFSADFGWNFGKIRQNCFCFWCQAASEWQFKQDNWLLKETIKYDGKIDCRNSYPDDKNYLQNFLYIQSSNHSSKIEQRTSYTLVNWLLGIKNDLVYWGIMINHGIGKPTDQLQWGTLFSEKPKSKNGRLDTWLVVWNHGILWLSIQLGISSSQLTNSIIFQRGWLKPPTSFM